MRKVYKVLLHDKNDNLTSYIIEDGKYCLNYSPEFWTKSLLPGYGVFCFGSLMDAAAFKHPFHNRKSSIWEVYYRGLTVELPRMLVPHELAFEITDKFSINCSWPTGTVMCEKVRLKEMICGNCIDCEGYASGCVFFHRYGEE